MHSENLNVRAQNFQQYIKSKQQNSLEKLHVNNGTQLERPTDSFWDYPSLGCGRWSEKNWRQTDLNRFDLPSSWKLGRKEVQKVGESLKELISGIRLQCFTRICCLFLNFLRYLNWKIRKIFKIWKFLTIELQHGPIFASNFC